MSAWTVNEKNISLVESAYYRFTGKKEAVPDMVVLMWFFHLSSSEQAQIVCGEWSENSTKTE